MEQRIGYARVSTSDQNPDLQRDALRQAGCDDVYEETASGKSADRPQLAECLRRLRRGDTLVVWKLDRLGRSLSDLVQIADRLRAAGVYIELLQPRVVFDDSTMGKAMYAMFGTAAENQGRLGLEAQGSIDVPVIRDQVASILEGGRDAFIQRKEKYEF